MRKIILTFSFVFFLSYSFYAQQENDLLIHLDEFEVSANTNKLYSELGRILTVIDKQEIINLPVQSIDELLDYAAGMDVRQRGTGGVQADISIRGGSFDQVLVLLNGINITNPQTGHYNLDIPVDLSDVTKVEILQGSSARVLGVNAFSGAINIITEQPHKNELSSRVTWGSFNTTAQNVAANYNKGSFGAFASASHQRSDGYMDNTDYDISNAYIFLNKRLNNAGKLALQAGAQNKIYGANGFYSLAYPNQLDHTRTFFSAFTWHYDLKNWRWHAQVYWRQHHDWFELFRDYEGAPAWYTSHNYHQTDVVGGKLTSSYLSAIGKFTLGVDLRNEHIFSNVLGEKMYDTRSVPFGGEGVFTHQANRFLSGVYVDYSKTFNDLYVSGGAAANYTEDFGLQYFGGIDLGYEFFDKMKVFASFNTAVRLPTFTDLYYKSATQLSNPDLQPEKARTIEVGIKYEEHKWGIDAGVFYRLGDDVIDWVKKPDSIRWECKNLTNVNAYGADISFRYEFETPFIESLNVVYSFLQLDKKADGFDSKYALDYLKHKLLVSAQHRIWSNLVLTWKASFLDRSGNYSDFETGELVDYAPYFLLDGKIMWTDKRFDVYADLNNILNTKYADYGGLPLPGFNFSAGIKIRIQ
ncbi:TonB-dependent receptor [Paludibacter sp. 221]|uniref:TonB-dependent receptor n=1 Tax=Paludibacter sp. 221 TaxID=2302939 RepID=UPI0013D6E3C1|nr:TonB-dependent receptor [Paludibacter sp. 221]NDV47560.1 TonB-dependent receptor [Paludibacter sp. 221]